MENQYLIFTKQCFNIFFSNGYQINKIELLKTDFKKFKKKR